MIGALVPTITIGQIFGPLLAVLFMVFGGLFANLDSIGSWISWIQYISLVANANKALSQNEFYGRSFNCASKTQGNQCVQQSGEDIVKSSSLNDPSLGIVTLVNIGMMAAFCIIGMIGFYKTTKPIIKLK
eukprot:NODE_424_length_7676_cov_0.895209.p7 type:complete len:130 gc:universal NODE_424_length_7676_cov_0.895209:4126-4515(+)